MTGDRIDPALRLGTVHLAVSDLGRSTDFYERVIGLPRITGGGEQVLLGPEPERPLLALTRLHEPTPVPPRATGLYHVALLHPTRASLADSLVRVASARWPFTGASDHGVSEALYLDDPDGLGLELYADRARSEWPEPDGADPVRMYTLAVDLDSLVAAASPAPLAHVPPGTVVGHVHMKVADLDRAVAFYRDALGLSLQAHLPSAAFLAADGYHHHVGLNTWESRGALPPPDTAPGLRLVELALSDPSELEALEARLARRGVAEVHRDDSHVAVHDPDHQALSFAVRAAVTRA